MGPGCVAHVSMADPAQPGAGRGRCEESSSQGCEDFLPPRGGTYLVMAGRQFSTRAESNLYRSWGCDVIGMTNMPEVKLAREAEICYATVAMVTDYDCWHDEHAHVDVAAVIKVLHENVDKAAGRAARPADFPREHPPCPIGSAERRRRHHHAAASARPRAVGQLPRGGWALGRLGPGSCQCRRS